MAPLYIIMIYIYHILLFSSHENYTLIFRLVFLNNKNPCNHWSNTIQMCLDITHANTKEVFLSRLFFMHIVIFDLSVRIGKIIRQKKWVPWLTTASSVKRQKKHWSCPFLTSLLDIFLLIKTLGLCFDWVSIQQGYLFY